MKKFYTDEENVTRDEVDNLLNGFFEQYHYLSDRDRENFILYTIEYLSSGRAKEPQCWTENLDSFIETHFKEED